MRTEVSGASHRVAGVGIDLALTLVSRNPAPDTPYLTPFGDINGQYRF